MRLEYYIGWFQQLLEDGLEAKVPLSNINVRNCIGTVLAINGFRKYFYVYQPKRARKWIRKTDNVTQAIGFFDTDEESANEGDEEDEKSKVLFVDELLTGLTFWMDKVFDGSVTKIRITNWTTEMSS
jgi:DnaJ family protein C protein 16